MVDVIQLRHVHKGILQTIVLDGELVQEDEHVSVLGARVPSYVMDEVDTIVDRTKRTHKEEVVTFCKKPSRDRIYVGGHARGKGDYVDDVDCNRAFGNAVRVGTVHTHPVDDKGPGVLPSPEDIAAVVEASHANSTRQTDCIANHKAPYMLCFTPKAVPSKEKVIAYHRAADKTLDSRRADPYLHNNVGQDFTFDYYDIKRGFFKKRGEHVKDPQPKKIVQSAIGDGRKWVRELVKDMELGPYCQYVQDLSMPGDDRVGEECKNYLKEKKFLFGLIKY